MEKQRKKYESENKNLRGQARMSENEHLNKKEEENQSLLKTNSALISQLSVAKGAQEQMEN